MQTCFTFSLMVNLLSLFHGMKTMWGPIEGPPETPRTSQYYGIKGLKGALNWDSRGKLIQRGNQVTITTHRDDISCATTFISIIIISDWKNKAFQHVEFLYQT